MAEIDYSKIKILIADDVMLNIVLVKKVLSSRPYQIRTASNGQQTLQAIVEEQPDLLLLDLMMPGIDGFEVIRKIRAGECGNPNMRIVILSALSREEDKVKCLNLGANGYITKPILLPLLLETVNEQIEAIVGSQG
ncbi:MAG: response regulator [Bacteroidaceae bacterium]|jgi:CheY-like chemotaxis protein|nr:response regulator [Bacteroidaceae bacterium]MDO4950962.1 response regulator [Bacteroidales bacterium]MBR3372945.1 response regulator [Bacteroidaceae bacterium]MBR3633619.1 response regulator [Bacteroidaceae bacterium]MBR3733544.1 response regulator [Bacteroidaceae bacterium]